MSISDIIFLILAGIAFLGVSCLILAIVGTTWYQCHHIDEIINELNDSKV